MGTASTTITIASTFTAESLRAPLQFWIDRLQLNAEIQFGAWGQVFQQLLDRSSTMARNIGGVNVILLRIEDWRTQAEQTATDFVQAVKQVSHRMPSPLIVCLCPGAPSAGERIVSSELVNLPGVHLITAEQLSALYTVTDFRDAAADRLAAIPYTPLFFTALATMIARKISALNAPPYKLIVLDCDNTLWDGVCAEDGPEGVRIDPEFQAVQEFMIRQHDAGMLLALCSKNDEADVAAVFESHPKMLLKRDHFVSWQVNWRPKSHNLKLLADDLRLSPDACIFLDDNPVECAEVRANAPEVLTLQLPREPHTKARFLEHVWLFDHATITAEGSTRTKLYQENARRGEFQKESLSFREFLSGLNLEVNISTLLPDEFSRASERTYRTNQFNVTGQRISVEQLKAICFGGRQQCYGVRAADRFGDYGLCGLMVVDSQPLALQVETFLLSCRAMGKGIEYRMLAKLGDIARQQQLDSVQFRLVPTEKNTPAREFLREVCRSELSIRADAAATAKYEPRSEQTRHQVTTETAAEREFAKSVRAVAEELQTVDQIHKAVVEYSRRPTEKRTSHIPPATPLERQVAEIWSDILGIEEIGAHDSFFDLGGHSLLAMQVLARISKRFQVELSPSVLYLGQFTVSGLSKAILAEQIQQAGVVDLKGILEKLDMLD